MVDEQLHDRIEQYLLGHLSATEAAQFEAQMKADPALADQVALQRLALQGLQRMAARDMRDRFEQWDAETEEVSPEPGSSPPKGRFNPWLWSTMILLLLLTAGAFLYFGQKQKEQTKLERERREIAFRDSLIDQLQADYRAKATELDSLQKLQGIAGDSLTRLEMKRLGEELERKDKALRELERRRFSGKAQIAMNLAPPAPKFRSRGSNDDAQIEGTRAAFEKSDFNEAVRLLKSIPANDARQAKVTQMLPYALFYAGKYREAIPAFIKLWEQDADNEYMNAQGYLLLCYLAEGNMQEARQMRMVILQDREHIFYDMARDLSGTLGVQND